MPMPRGWEPLRKCINDKDSSDRCGEFLQVFFFNLCLLSEFLSFCVVACNCSLAGG